MQFWLILLRNQSNWMRDSKITLSELSSSAEDVSLMIEIYVLHGKHSCKIDLIYLKPHTHTIIVSKLLLFLISC